MTKLVEVKDVLLDISLVDVNVIVETDDILSDNKVVLNVSIVVGLTVLNEVKSKILFDVPMVDDVTTPRVVSCDMLSVPSVTGPILLEEDS